MSSHSRILQFYFVLAFNMINVRSIRIVKNSFLNRIKFDVINSDKSKKRKEEEFTLRISSEKKIINVCQESFIE